VNVFVNGQPCALPEGATVATLVELRGASGRGIAVAVDGIVVPRRVWDRKALIEGQQVELVRAVQGG
jgi:sulfur carrier protein